MKPDGLARFGLICALVGFLALGVAVVPGFWHPRQGEQAHGLMAFAEQWPGRAIEPPAAPEPMAFCLSGPICGSAVRPVAPATDDLRPVKVEIYRAVTEKPKTGLKIVEAEEPSEPRRDVCYPGRKVERRHGWRCVYHRRR